MKTHCTPRLGNLFIITGHIHCGKSLVGRKNEQFYLLI